MKSKKIVSIALSALTSAYLCNTLILNRLNIQSENNISDELIKASGPNVRFKNSDKKSYSISLDYDETIKSFDFESTNTNLLDYEINGNRLNATLETDSEVGNATFNVTFDNFTDTSETIFSVNSNNNFFISNISSVDALIKSLKYDFQNNFITEQEARDKFDEFSRRGVTQSIKNEMKATPTLNSIESTQALNTVSGHVTVKVLDSNGNEVTYPLSNVTIRLVDYDPGPNSDEVLGEALLDQNGYYHFTFQNKDDWSELGGYDIQVELHARGNTFAFYTAFPLVDAQIKSDRISNIDTGATTTIDMCVDATSPKGNDNNIYFVSAAGMGLAEKYAIEELGMKYSSSKFLNLMYSGYINSFTYKNIGLLSRDSWNNWSTCVHEYTHHIQFEMGTYPHNESEIDELIKDFSNFDFSNYDLTKLYNLIDLFETIEQILKIFEGKYSHSYSEDLIATKSPSYGKDFATKLAWSEAVADFLPSILFDINYGNIKQYDCFISKISFLENNTENNSSGEGVEASIAQYLWDLYDSYSNSEPDDLISINHKNLFSIVFTPGLMTLYDFVKKIEQINFEYQRNNGPVLTLQNIGPDIITIKYVPENNDFAMLFKRGGTSNSRNNKFVLEAYSTNGDLVYSYTFTDNTDNDSIVFTLPANNVAQLNNMVRTLTQVYFTVAAYNDSYSHISGPYHSEYKLLTIHDELKISPTDFNFPDAYPGEETTASISVSGHSLTTRRLRCGFIQGEYINLSPRRGGYGTAYLEIDFDKPISKLTVDLSLWSNDERYYDEDNPSARIEYYSNTQNNYVQALDLLTVQPALPTDRTNQNTYEIVFNEDTSSIRFYTHFEKMSGKTDRNKGRISIGDMKVIYA